LDAKIEAALDVSLPFGSESFSIVIGTQATGEFGVSQLRVLLDCAERFSASVWIDEAANVVIHVPEP
jgi:hypothetical protein